jgi:hypothetical protein
MTKNLPFLFVISLLTCCVEVDISVPSFPDISNYFGISDGLPSNNNAKLKKVGKNKGANTS